MHLVAWYQAPDGTEWSDLPRQRRCCGPCTKLRVGEVGPTLMNGLETVLSANGTAWISIRQASCPSWTLRGTASAGGLPGRLGDLAGLTALRIGDNALSGRLPTSLSPLTPLQELRYANTDLCVPVEAWFQEWLAAIRAARRHRRCNALLCPPATSSSRCCDETTGWTQTGRNQRQLAHRRSARRVAWRGARMRTGRVVSLDLRS